MNEYIYETADLYLDKDETMESFEQRFREEVVKCKELIIWKAGLDGVNPDDLTYEIEPVRRKWDLHFVVKGQVKEAV